MPDGGRSSVSTLQFCTQRAGDRLSQTVGVTTTHYVLDPAAGLTQVLADGTNTYLYGDDRLAQYQAGMRYFGAVGLGSVRQLYDASGQGLEVTKLSVTELQVWTFSLEQS